MRRSISAALGGPLVLSLIAVSAWLLMGGSEDGARAQGGSGLDPNVVGIDVKPDASNTKTTLGTIDNCVEVGGVGSTFDVDVFLNDVPIVDSGPYHNLGAFEYRLIYDNARLKVAATDHDFLMATYGSPPAGVADMGDCSPYTPCPDTDGELYTSVVGLGSEDGGEGGGEDGAEPPGSLGVLSRLTFEVVGSEGTFDYLTLTDLNFGGYEPGVTPWQDEVDQVWDASHTPRYGIIAIAPASCAAVPSPTPGPTSTPTSTPTPTPTTTPPATPTPTPPGPAVAWTYSCYLGASQPTEDALATISGDVLAAYRLRPDQGYDRWFPARPTVNTMTEFNPYDALFLLVATGATWPQQPSGAPPSDANLVFGWNSVCYTGQTKEPESATQGIDGDFAILYTLAPGQAWQRFVPGRPEASTLTQLDSVTPVLILATEEGGALWVFDP